MLLRALVPKQFLARMRRSGLDPSYTPSITGEGPCGLVALLLWCVCVDVLLLHRAPQRFKGEAWAVVRRESCSPLSLATAC